MTVDPEVMGGVACFVGTRVPIDTVLASLDEGLTLEEVRQSYADITAAHVSAAREYAAAHPRSNRARRFGEVVLGMRPREKPGSPEAV